MNLPKAPEDKCVGGNSFLELERRGKLLEVPFDVNFEFILLCEIIKTHIQNSPIWLFIELTVVIKNLFLLVLQVTQQQSKVTFDFVGSRAPS